MTPDVIFARTVALHKLLASLLTDYPLRLFLMAGVSQPALASRLPAFQFTNEEGE